MALTPIIYLIATNYILSVDETMRVEMKNIVQAGTLEQLVNNIPDVTGSISIVGVEPKISALLESSEEIKKGAAKSHAELDLTSLEHASKGICIYGSRTNRVNILPLFF